MKANPETMKEIYRLLNEYEKDVRQARQQGSLTSDKTVDTYLRHANTFVRWCDDDFVPGSQKGRN